MYTKWIQGFPCENKSAEKTMLYLRRFLGPQVRPEHVYTDNSSEFISAMEQLNFTHDTSTQYRPQTNGVAERAVQRVKEGTAVTLLQSGLEDSWWEKPCIAIASYAT